MELIVVDHLPCLNNELGLCTGLSKQGVSDFGRSVAELVWLDDDVLKDVTTILSSTLPRAVETVRLCFRQLPVRLVFDERLAAIDYGVCHDFPMDVIQRGQEDHIYRPYPQGESYADMASRYRSCLQDSAAALCGQRAIIIGHYGTREILNHLVTGTPLDEAFRIRARARGNTSLSTSDARKAAIKQRILARRYAMFQFHATV